MSAGAAGGAAFSVVVPVHDEAALLPETVPRLLDGLDPAAELVFVCNGCSDGSAAILRGLAGGRARVIELAEAGKPGAIRAGEAAVAAFPRVYLDADVWISGAAVTALVAVQRAGGWELVSPLLRADTAGASRLARWVTRVWLATPHMRHAGFHCVLAVSREGRARWDAFPDLTNDDDFIVGRISVDRRAIVSEIRATIRPPRSFAAWVRVRERWARGGRELARSGLIAHPGPGPGYRALLRLLPRRPLPVLAYLAAVISARIRARRDPDRAVGWYRDPTSRAHAPHEPPVADRRLAADAGG